MAIHSSRSTSSVKRILPSTTFDTDSEYCETLICVISSVGRVSALQAECHRFETDMALYKAKVVPIIVSGFDSHHQDFLMR